MQGMNYGGFGSNTMGMQQPSFMGGGMPAQNNQFQVQNNGFGRSMQPSYLQGRMVGTEQEIVSGEVPNDGSFAVFVQNDLSTIWAKAWMGDGLIHTNTYKKVEESSPENQGIDQTVVLQTILEKLSNIESRIAKLENRNYTHNFNKKNNVQNKVKEAPANESND